MDCRPELVTSRHLHAQALVMTHKQAVSRIVGLIASRKKRLAGILPVAWREPRYFWAQQPYGPMPVRRKKSLAWT